MAYRFGMVAVLCSMLAGCGGSDDDDDPTMGGDGDAGGDEPGDGDGDASPGMTLDGLMYSPGGNELPHPDQPFHPTTNNPYAVRCIDAWPHYKTRFAGDEFCILPPPPDQGLQVGIHPQGPDWYSEVSQGDLGGYDDASDEWVLEPGDEETINFRSGVDNPEGHRYYRTYFRMRTGSHHNIITLHEPGSEREVWLPGQELPGLFDSGSGMLLGILGGQQRPDDNTPVSFEAPPEDEGLYLDWPANPTILYNMHHFNVTEDDLLKEGWVNVWWEPGGETRVSWYMGLSFDQIGALNLTPGQERDYHYSWPIRGDQRMIRVFGHRHAWTSNFSSWIERAGGDVELIYQSFDWFDMPTYRYDSAVENPPLDPEARTDGAASGVLELKAGDSLHFNCHMEFTDERAAETGAPQPAQLGRLGFANEAFRGEMCIQFGNVAGGSLGLPTANASPVPDFATVD